MTSSILVGHQTLAEVYTGNVIATVKAPLTIPIKFFAVRSTAFKAALVDKLANVENKVVNSLHVPDCLTQCIKTELPKSNCLDLSVARPVASGKRALKNAETFKVTLEPLRKFLVLLSELHVPITQTICSKSVGLVRLSRQKCTWPLVFLVLSSTGPE